MSINPDLLERGTHFWAIMHDKIVMMAKFNDGYYICGSWECSIGLHEFEVIEVVKHPTGYSIKNNYYE